MFFGADDDDVGEGGDGGDDSGGKFNSPVDLIDLKDVVSGSVLTLDESLHAMVDLLGSEVDVGSQKS